MVFSIFFWIGFPVYFVLIAKPYPRKEEECSEAGRARPHCTLLLFTAAAGGEHNRIIHKPWEFGGGKSTLLIIPAILRQSLNAR